MAGRARGLATGDPTTRAFAGRQGALRRMWWARRALRHRSLLDPRRLPRPATRLRQGPAALPDPDDRIAEGPGPRRDAARVSDSVAKIGGSVRGVAPHHGWWPPKTRTMPRCGGSKR